MQVIVSGQRSAMGAMNMKEQSAAASSAAKRVCDACRATVPLAGAVSYVQWEGAWFCARCWRELPADEIARVAREVALRGVPLS